MKIKQKTILAEKQKPCKSPALPGRFWRKIPPLNMRDISLFWRVLPIFCPFLRKSPNQNLRISFCILYISLFGISGLPTKIWEYPSLFNESPYLKKKISLFVISIVSHVCRLTMLYAYCTGPIMDKFVSDWCNYDLSYVKKKPVFAICEQ